MAKVTRNIQYRYLDRESALFGDNTLQGVIAKAFKKNRKGDKIGKVARARITDLAQEGQSTLLNAVSDTSEGQTIFTGQLILYKKGFDVPTLDEEADSDKNKFDIKQYTTDGKSKPIEGILYFAVLGDHVGLIASNAVTSRWLERYLTWLLNDATSLIETDENVILNAKIDLTENGKKDIEDAKSFTINTSSGVKPDTGFSVTRALRQKAKTTTDNIFDILKILGIAEDAIQEIADSVPEDGSLEGDFNVYVKQKRIKKAIAKSTLDKAFRNIPTDDLSMISKEGSIQGNFLKLSQPVRVTTVSGSLLDPDSAIECIIDQMRKWLKAGYYSLDVD